MVAGLKLLLPQPHLDRRLQLSWSLAQWGLLLLPLSALLGGVSVLIGALIAWRYGYRKILARRVNAGFVLLSGLMVVSAVFAYRPLDAGLGLFNFLPFFILFAGLSELVQTPDQLKRLAWLIALSSVPVVAIGLAQMIAGVLGLRQVLHVQVLWVVFDWLIDLNGTPPGRMSSVLTYANVLANYLVISFVISLGLLIESRRQKASPRFSTPLLLHFSTPSALSLLVSALVLANGVALILTNSRNAWAIAAGACLGFALYLGWRWLVAIVGGVTGVVLAAAFAPAPVNIGLRSVVPAFFWARLTDQLYPNRPLPTLRSTQWQFAWSLMQQRPWLGWGLRNFNPLYQSAMQFNLGHPHNLLLMLLCETGIPATLLFFSLVGWMVVQGIRRLQQIANESDRLILFTFILSFLGNTVFCLFDLTFFDARINVLGWVVLAGIWGNILFANSHKPL
jgi:O-antigen ligase